MKTANDLKIGDIITNFNSAFTLTGVIIDFYSTDGAFIKGHVKPLTTKKGTTLSELEGITPRFAFNKKTPLQNILV